jgi:hypothetical protein
LQKQNLPLPSPITPPADLQENKKCSGGFFISIPVCSLSQFYRPFQLISRVLPFPPKALGGPKSQMADSLVFQTLQLHTKGNIQI